MKSPYEKFKPPFYIPDDSLSDKIGHTICILIMVGGITAGLIFIPWFFVILFAVALAICAVNKVLKT